MSQNLRALTPELADAVDAKVAELVAVRFPQSRFVQDVIALLALGVADLAMQEPDPPAAFHRIWRDLWRNP